MPAAITDKFKKTRSSGRPVPAYLTGTKTIGASTATINVATGWPTDTAIDFIVYRKTTSNEVVAGSVTTWTATLSGTTLSNLTLNAGTDMEYTSGEQSVVMMVPTAEGMADMVEGIITEHNQDGTHDATKVAMLAGTQTFTGNKTFSGTLTFSSRPVAPNPYKFRGYLSSAQNTTASNWAKISMDGETYDSNNNFDTSTNKGRYTAPKAGFWRIKAAVGITGSGTTILGIAVYKNGSIYSYGGQYNGSASGTVRVAYSDDISLSQNDYIEVYVFCNGAVAIDTGSAATYFSGSIISET